MMILTDRNLSEFRAAMPTLLVAGGIHHHLVRSGSRTRVSIILETGEAREVHHFSTLSAMEPTRHRPTWPLIRSTG